MTAHQPHPQSARGGAARRSALLTLLSLLLAAAPALAATYYVSTGGNDANPGTQAAPWRTLAKANATLRAGDACWISNGSYADAIQPATNGASGARISYVGNLSNPSAVTVPNILLNRSHVSVKGVTASNDFKMEYLSETQKAWRDSVAYCRLPGVSLWGVQDCMVARNVVSGQTTLAYDHGYATPTVDPAVASSMRDTLRENVFTTLITYKGMALRAARNCLFENNTFNFRFEVARGSDLQGRYIYNSFHNTFRGNRWNVEADASLPGGSQYVAFSLRDSSSYNLFDRDTMYCGLQGGANIGGRLTNAGNANWVGQCYANQWKNCVYKTTGYTYNQDLLNGSTLENSVFASRTTWGLWLFGGVKNTTIRNCTIASWAAAAVKVEGDIRLGGNQIHSNVFYADSVAACFSGRAVMDFRYTSGFTQDYNLFYARTAASGVTASSQAVYWASSGCSGVGPGTGWASTSGSDTHSRFGSPQFVNASWSGFDAHLRTGSPAIAAGQGGADAGAYPFGGGGTSLSSITNLAVVQRSNDYALLAWTAPSGVAQYDLRMSNQPIDDGNFGAAAAVAVAPAVMDGGSAQSYALTGLAASTTYHFAIKWQDGGGNWSAVSNVPSTTTTPVDQLPPARISDFRSP